MFGTRRAQRLLGGDDLGGQGVAVGLACCRGAREVERFARLRDARSQVIEVELLVLRGLINRRGLRAIKAIPATACHGTDRIRGCTFRANSLKDTHETALAV